MRAAYSQLWLQFRPTHMQRVKIKEIFKYFLLWFFQWFSDNSIACFKSPCICLFSCYSFLILFHLKSIRYKKQYFITVKTLLLKFEASQQESCGLLRMLYFLQSPDGKVCRCLLSLHYLWCSLMLKCLCWNFLVWIVNPLVMIGYWNIHSKCVWNYLTLFSVGFILCFWADPMFGHMYL